MTARKPSRNVPDPTATPSMPAATPLTSATQAAPGTTATPDAPAPAGPAASAATPAKRKKAAEKRAAASPRGRAAAAAAGCGRCVPSTTATGGGCSPVSTTPRTICSVRTWSAAVWWSGCCVRSPVP